MVLQGMSGGASFDQAEKSQFAACGVESAQAARRVAGLETGVPRSVKGVTGEIRKMEKETLRGFALTAWTACGAFPSGRFHSAHVHPP